MGRRPRKDSLKNQEIVALDAQQELEMFQQWVSGRATYVSLAKKHGMHESTVSAIAKRNKWREMKTKLNEKVFAATLDTMKDRIVGLIGMLDADVTLLKKSVTGKKKLLLSKDERAYVLKYLEFLSTEVKLHDGKPTAINSGEVVNRIILPEGVEDAWIIPPDPTVRIEREVKVETQVIDDTHLDDLVQAELEKKK